MSVQTDFTRVLLKKRLPVARKEQTIREAVDNQADFDELFVLLFHHERLLVQRAAQAVDKITHAHPQYLEPHRTQLLSLLKSPNQKELKSYVIKLISRISLTLAEVNTIWNLLTHYAVNPNENKLVRLSSLQTLSDFSEKDATRKSDLSHILNLIEHDPAAWIQARVKKLRLDQ